MRAAVPMNLLPEMMEAGARRVLTPLRVWRTAELVLRRLLKGPLADHIAFQPHDACRAGWKMPTRCCGAVSASTARRWTLPQGVSVFDLPPPSEAWAEELHGFSWLASLAMAGGEAARTLATNLIAQWVKRHGHYCEPHWSPHVMGAPADAHFQPWPAGGAEFRHAVALANCS